MNEDQPLELANARVASVDRWWEEGLLVRDGVTLPFLVQRGWSGPVGHYLEEWWIGNSAGAVQFHQPPKEIFVRSPQAVSRYVDIVDEPIALEPGPHHIVFAVFGSFMGAVDFEVRPAPSRTPSGGPRS